MSGGADAPADWVVVRTASSVHDALLWRSVLEGHGIDAFVPDQFAFTSRPMLEFSQGVRVMVSAGALERARALLEGLDA